METVAKVDELAEALVAFTLADAAYSAANEALAIYQRTHVDRRAIVVGEFFNTRIGRGDPEREHLEADIFRTRAERSEALRVWAAIKTARENQQGGCHG